MISFDDQSFYSGDKEWEPKIALDSSIEKANAVIVTLDLSVQSSLQWDKEIEEAKDLIAQGKKILWHLSFGEFQELPLSIKDEAFGASLKLSISHFVETIARPFEKETMGVLLYKGSIDFYNLGLLNGDFEEDFDVYQRNLNLKETRFDKLHQSTLGRLTLTYYASDVFSNFIWNIKELLPPTLPKLLFFENTDLDDGLAIHLVSKERWEGYAVFGKNFPKGSVSYRWHDHALSEVEPKVQTNQALIVPSQSCHEIEGLQAFYLLTRNLLDKNIQLKYIPDPDLIFEWHGIDKVYVASQCVDAEGLRRLQGFVAAGGEVCSFGHALALHEQSAFV